MEQLYQQTVRLLQETQKLAHEMTMSPLKEGYTPLESKVNENLQQLQQDCFRLENMARKEVPTRRQAAKYQVEQLVADVRMVQNAYTSRQQKKSQAEQAASQREELLSRRYTPNTPAMDTSITIDAGIQYHDRLQSANSAMDDLLGSASSIIGSITKQGGILKGAHRRMLDVMNTLGLSNTVMRLIEKRSAQDRVVFFGGVIVTLIVMYIVIRYAL
ncbi:Golgi SNAP receptor complex member 2-like [Dysidea avara]|uniref:Golgi SNAP receptor complex member 2-like n=1 Tax=Dysidea avara TaxID=196820 RepID=UPI00332288A1